MSDKNLTPTTPASAASTADRLVEALHARNLESAREYHERLAAFFEEKVDG